MRGAAHMRKAIGIERMDIQNGNALGAGFFTPLRIMQGKHLHTTAAIPLHTMTGAGQDQQLVRIRSAVQCHIHRQRLAIPPGLRVDVGLD